MSLSLMRSVVAVCAIVLSASAQAQSLQGRYFVVVWGYQGTTNAAVDAHTFATFYRGESLGSPATISWLPATRVVRARGEERGRNLSLGETLALARARKATVRAFGPYEITSETYRKALARIRELNSGRFAYTMINGGGSAVNCILAVSAVGGPLGTGLNWGFAASSMVARHLASKQTIDARAAAILRLGAYTQAAAQ
jgi:hypothetical protein